MGGFFGGGGASVADFVGATTSNAGVSGLVPAPAAGDQRKFLRGDATIQSISANLVPITPSRRTNGITFVGNTGDISTRATANGYVIFSPIYVRETKSYTTYSVYVSAAGTAGSVGKIAIYSIDSSAAPSNLICSSGTFATDSTGLKQPTMTSTVINDGWYYAAFATNSSSSVSLFAEVNYFARAIIGGTVAGAGPIVIDYSTKTYASLWPDPWSGTDLYAAAYHFVCELT